MAIAVDFTGMWSADGKLADVVNLTCSCGAQRTIRGPWDDEERALLQTRKGRRELLGEWEDYCSDDCAERPA